MPEQAKITSIDAIEAFRSNLIVYIGKARPTLDEVAVEVMRVRNWLQNDQRIHWDGQIKRWTKALETAKQELFSATIANLRETTSAEIMAVRRAERGLDDAQTKLRILKKWDRDFESHVATLVKQLEKMQSLLTNDLPVATAYLAETVKILNAYADVGQPLQGGNP